MNSLPENFFQIASRDHELRQFAHELVIYYLDNFFDPDRATEPQIWRDLTQLVYEALNDVDVVMARLTNEPVTMCRFKKETQAPE